MAWTSPRTWTTGEVVTAALMNTHLRDNLKAIGDAWTTYTPVLTASTTNPTLGTSPTQTGRYLSTGKDTRGTFDITFGTGSPTAGSGNYQVSAPVTISSAYTGQSVGRGTIFDSSGSVVAYVDLVASSANFLLRYSSTYPTGTLTTVTHAVPWAWSASDYIRGSFMYEAA